MWRQHPPGDRSGGLRHDGHVCPSGRERQLPGRDRDLRSRLRLAVPGRDHDGDLHRHGRRRQPGDLYLYRDGDRLDLRADPG